MFLYLNFEVFFSMYCLFKISPTLMGDITFSKSKITYSKSDTCITFFLKYITCIPSVHTCIWWKGNWYLLHFPYKLLFIPHIRSLATLLDKVRAGSTIICTLFECACDVRQHNTVCSIYCEYIGNYI